MKGVFAPTGSYIPGTDLHLKASKIRGEESNGMLCSSRELQLGDDHSGIIDLPADTPDRPAGRRGARPRRSGDRDQGDAQPRRLPRRARHRARSRGGRPRHAEAVRRPSKIEGSYASPIKWTHGYEARPDSPCPIVVGRHFRGVKNGPSPDWLQRRLKAIGLRPISALVDITNLVTFDLNRPLHVFDAEEAQRRPRHAPGARGREDPGARRQDLRRSIRRCR